MRTGGLMSKSKVVNLRLKDHHVMRLDHLAQREGRTKAEMAAMLLERLLRLSEFPHVVIRDLGAGPEAFISGTRLRVWRIAVLAREVDWNTAWIAEYLDVPEPSIKDAVNYAEAFPEEIEAAIAENDRAFEELPRLIPNLEVFAVDLSTSDAPAP
jgi:uncharacterized protein (DUF433 family)